MATLGKMSEHIDLIQPVVTKDAAGFATTRDEVIASVRAYMEVRHASPAWVNRAAYTKADLLFRIRAIPGVKITEAMQISSARGRYVIDAVEPIGRYLQILAHLTEAEGAL
ncbi:head-tail adaptor protein [Actinotignum urinale]|uniref:Head-tail adaptor protein n=1 Tax=Actinotignum urinale TaxID=190146 RepID=A0AAW9HY83_9ACTO|nr:head-tail adaptor protein [Actinotignum urinale]MDY5155367.1 head-tail adaptor protein [Actinotignum urinale]